MRNRLAVFALLLLLAPGSFVLAAGSGKKNLIKVFMLNTGADADARGKVMLVVNKAQTSLKIKVSRLDPGVYDVIVDGTVFPGEITVNADGDGKVQYRVRNRGSRAGGQLPYDPRGLPIEIAAAGGGPVLLTAEIPATPAESGEVVVIEVDLANSGVQPAAEAEAEFKSRFGRMKFGVEVEGMMSGTYDLFVGGADVGDIVVGADGKGDIEFDSRPSTDDDDDDSIDLLLTFDPRGQMIEVKEQGSGVVLFSGTL